MNDRELLELAAKAAGMQVKPRTQLVNDSDDVIAIYVRNGWYEIYQKWGPLEDDRDALLLAAKLKLNPNIDRWYAAITGRNEREEHGKDLLAATRREIVRAAAEIGRDMP